MVVMRHGRHGAAGWINALAPALGAGCPYCPAPGHPLTWLLLHGIKQKPPIAAPCQPKVCRPDEPVAVVQPEGIQQPLQRWAVPSWRSKDGEG